jgi:hypothetical protein
VVSEVREPEISVALSGESARDPGVFVDEVPNSNSDAAVHGKTGGNNACIVGGLLSESGAVFGESAESDVQLGVGGFDSLGGVALKDGDEVRVAGRAADDEMGLETDTVDLDSAGLEGGDEVCSGSGFGTGVLDVVVVVVELDVWVVESSGLESDGDVFGSDGVEELKR